MSSQKYSIWLVPAKEFLIPLSKCVDYNSFISQQPSFTPHMTLFTSEQEIFADFDTFVAKLGCESISLKIESLVKNLDSYYMNYYLKLLKTKELDKLFNKVKEIDLGSDYQLNPHISLAYGANNHDGFLTYNFSKEIVFDEIAIMKYSSVGSTNAVLDFKILKSYNLQTRKLIKY
ncbi:hypothetical protein LO80_01675 [Candidatus Francisella endociliophora]|uniref:Cyclic phosphodiesterase-like protein n=1 Tax=Candidatus Francisella endociliophora TaxID=653937 RepID=A0A097EML6_9GAMM|nr:hypothetical protein [Francisella sp. FSC1006]AIT08811.1 hypothetical protein LO80_01675 [Francisella sp. FSC1006]